MKKAWASAVMAVAAGAAALASGQTQGHGPTTDVGPAVAAKASNPAPSATARNQGKASSIGNGAASVRASEPSAYWTELVDIEGNGIVKDNEFLFDKQRGILYTYRQDSYRCADGTPQNGNVLMGIYTQGNATGKPAGSGWYVVAVNAGQCGEKKAGLFGCRFDISGKPTTCGTAKVKEASGEIEVAVKQ